MNTIRLLTEVHSLNIAHIVNEGQSPHEYRSVYIKRTGTPRIPIFDLSAFLINFPLPPYLLISKNFFVDILPIYKLHHP